MLRERARKDKIDEDVETTKETSCKENIYYEEYSWVNNPATIFYAVMFGVIFLGFIPWVAGWIKIFQWIF